MSAPAKHESVSTPGLFYWAEAVSFSPHRIPAFCVVSGGNGFPATEAFDDWVAKESDADAIAQKLARGEL